jgi:hypothetical protein
MLLQQTDKKQNPLHICRGYHQTEAGIEVEVRVKVTWYRD